MELSELGVTPQKIRQFSKKGIADVTTLLLDLPRKYLDFTKDTGILPEENMSCLTVQVERFQRTYGRIETLKAYTVVVPSGEWLTITLFNQNYRWNNLISLSGQRAFVAGKIRQVGQNRFEMLSPVVFEASSKSSRCIRPVYRKIAGMSEAYRLETLSKALDKPGAATETLPDDLLKKLSLPGFHEALLLLHRPQSLDDPERGRRRLRFDAMLSFALQQEWAIRHIALGSPFRLTEKRWMDALQKRLPYALTEDQRKAVEALVEAAEHGRRIHALVQGDVGCGKTAVAFLLMAAFANSGFQSVLMAPTQVLAQQHYEALKEQLEPLGCTIGYLGSELRAAERRQLLADVSSGALRCIVGTHAVLAGDVHFHHLALVITDEEHRFGVAQRTALVEKAAEGVHSITMSATPIPRSLAQVLYGNALQLHTIRTMPEGRLPVITGIAVNRTRIYKFLFGQVRKGYQAYIVCPAIDQNDEYRTGESVAEISRAYTAALAPHGVRLSTLTGRDSRQRTEEVLSAFTRGETDILIATTVIEVGINVPNATAIVISGAERFGLSTLHQLRGRVGRGTVQSYCVLECGNAAPQARERLEVLCHTTDGFEIAEADLRLRGAGDLEGLRQSGDNETLRLVLAYPEEYARAQEAAKELLDTGNLCPLVMQAIQKT